MKNPLATLVVFFLVLSFTSFSQIDTVSHMGVYAGAEDDWMYREFNFDSLDLSKVNREELVKKLDKIKAFNDSIYFIQLKRNMDVSSDSLAELYHLISRKASKNYHGFGFAANQGRGYLSRLNDRIKAYGGTGLDEVSYGFTVFNLNWKRGRRVHEFSFLSVQQIRGTNNKGVKIDYNSYSPVAYRFGFSLINARWLDVFPFGALRYEGTNISFRNDAELAVPNSAGAYDTLIKYSSSYNSSRDFELKKKSLILDYGLEMDFHLVYSKYGTGLILALRAAKTQSLISGRWTMGKDNYSVPDIIAREYIFEIALKIYFRNDSGRYDTGYQGPR